MTEHIIGFFMNPIAGMGGKVGLKGTDGQISKARELGATEIAPSRAKEALVRFFHLLLGDGKGMTVRILTCGDPMGRLVVEQALEDVAESSGRLQAEGQLTLDDLVTIEEIYFPHIPTTPEDTKMFCKQCLDLACRIILFTGGDGTARDVTSAVGEDFPILGIPSGVKMHSGVFTHTPGDTGEALMDFLRDRAPLELREVVDLDEDAYRSGRISTKLFGYATVPVTTTIQGCKNIVSSVDDAADRRSIADGLQEFIMDHPGIYIMGAGSTLRDIGDHLGLELTPLGFDVIIASTDGKITVKEKDVNEQRILDLLTAGDEDAPGCFDDPSVEEIPDEKVRINRYLVVTPIGAQGFILGRGTQVVSGEVLDLIPRDNVLVVATPGKLAITPVLRVDVGAKDGFLRGFQRVLFGYRKYAMKKVE